MISLNFEWPTFFFIGTLLTIKMGRPTKREVHNRKISRAYRKENEPQRNFIFLNTLNFVFSIVALGLHYGKTALCFLLNNIKPPKKSTFYKEQHKVVNCLCQMACDSMNKYAKKTQKNDVVSVDGSWDHRRNGGECQAVFINQRIDKVIGVSLITKGSGKMMGNFNGSSQNMECEAIKRAIPKIKNLNFSGYVHDQKKDVTKIFKDNWSVLEEHLDANHVKKSLEKKNQKI